MTAELVGRGAIWKMFLMRVTEVPDAEAVLHSGKCVSYVELLERVEEAVLRIEGLPLKPQTIAVTLERGVDAVTWLLACLKTGITYLPLDPRWPESRRQLVLNSGSADLEVHASENGVALREMATARTPAGSNLACYTIFTSGSTGVPKGILVSEEALVNRLESLSDFLPQPKSRHQQIRFLLNTSIAFDISLVEMLLPLVTAGTMVVPPLTDDVDGFIEFLEQCPPSVVQGTPSFFRLISALGWPLGADVHIWCGGEQLRKGLADELTARAAVVRNFYGPTEATIWCTQCVLLPGRDVTAGKPIGTTQVYIDDSDAEIYGHGRGELILYSGGLALGYVDESQNTGRFVLETGRGRTYRTGDVASMSPDGDVIIHGRIDEQVKVNGFRVELGDVESHIEAMPNVSRCAVIQDAGGRLVAFVAAESFDARSMRTDLAKRLPAYAIPGTFHQLAHLPLTSAGKVDKQRLREGLRP